MSTHLHQLPYATQGSTATAVSVAGKPLTSDTMMTFDPDAAGAKLQTSCSQLVTVASRGSTEDANGKIGTVSTTSLPPNFFPLLLH